MVPFPLNINVVVLLVDIFRLNFQIIFSNLCADRLIHIQYAAPMPFPCHAVR
jgi:hypothetical protein